MYHLIPHVFHSLFHRDTMLFDRHHVHFQMVLVHIKTPPHEKLMLVSNKLLPPHLSFHNLGMVVFMDSGAPPRYSKTQSGRLPSHKPKTKSRPSQKQDHHPSHPPQFIKQGFADSLKHL